MPYRQTLSEKNKKQNKTKSCVDVIIYWIVFKRYSSSCFLLLIAVVVVVIIFFLFFLRQGFSVQPWLS